MFRKTLSDMKEEFFREKGFIDESQSADLFDLVHHIKALMSTGDRQIGASLVRFPAPTIRKGLKPLGPGISRSIRIRSACS